MKSAGDGELRAAKFKQKAAALDSSAAGMEVLSPSSPPRSPAVERYGPAQDAALQFLLQRASPGGREGAAGRKLYVAVGRSPEKTLGLLRWAFRRFGCREIGLLHVHQPSPLIPTLLGKFPVNQANENLVSSYRTIEREETKKILQSYLDFCRKAQVQANVIVTETDQIQNGIVDLVAQYGIRKLVMGSTSDNSCFKSKGCASKAIFTARHVPTFCEILFVSKGRHIWTREAREFADGFLPVLRSDETLCRGRFWSNPQIHDDELSLNPEFTHSRFLGGNQLQGIRSSYQNESDSAVVVSTNDSSVTCTKNSCTSRETVSTVASWHSSPSETEFPKEINSKDAFCDQLKEVTEEIEGSKRAAFLELAKRKQLESEAAEAVNQIKAYEAAHEREIKIREELEVLLRAIQLQHEELENQNDEALRELQNAMETVALLDSRAHDMARLRDEAVGELELIQSSIKILRRGYQKINQHVDSANWLGKRTSGAAASPNCSQLIVYGDHSYDCQEFTLSDLRTATCDFSKSFKLGQGSYGCLYKGEIMNKTVMIKRLHQHNIRAQVEFQQEVHVLGKMRHPHLMTLIGICPEALALVYEYVPNGTLQDCLFSRTTTPPMSWRIRVRIAAEISSALLFLHSSKPEKVIHGDLKPENIFLDYIYTCKLGNLGVCQLVQQDTDRNPFLCRYVEPQGAFPYIDPEYEMCQDLTTKSDVYSFGIIILQLLTGKPASGLESEVHQAVSSGNLSTILDPSAGEWPTDVARRLAEIGLQCIGMHAHSPLGLTRELVKALEQLHRIKEKPVPSFFLCPILQEIMQDPQLAADGFTYEGRVLREWFDGGRNTSPVTNAKLKHRNLTPNHALRFAIQDWLCQRQP